MEKAYITLGIPGCGKSYYIENNLKDCDVVSADEIKKVLVAQYMDFSVVHERSIELAEQLVMDKAKAGVSLICMDGGGVTIITLSVLFAT